MDVIMYLISSILCISLGTQHGMVLLTVLWLFKHMLSGGVCKYILKHISRNMNRICREGTKITEGLCINEPICVPTLHI